MTAARSLACLLLAATILPGCAQFQTEPAQTQAAQTPSAQAMATATGNTIEISNEQLLLQTLGGPYTRAPEAYETIDELLDELLAASADESLLKPKVLLINNPAILAWSSKAMATEQGSISICRGLLASLPSRAALAATLAHELAHLMDHSAAHAIARSNGKEDSEWEGRDKSSFAAHKNLQAEFAADRTASAMLQNTGSNGGMAGGMRNLLLLLSEKTANLKQQQNYQQRLEQLEPTLSVTQHIAAKSTNQPATLPWLRKMTAEEPFYRKYRDAQANLKQGEIYPALKAAQSLVIAAPDEAKFHVLKGDVLDQPSAPCKQYALASKINPNWFLPWLKLAECQLQQGQLSAAGISAAKSQSLLPTNHGADILKASQP